MDTENANRWLTLCANFAVVAGIVFLAFEIRQNSELLQAEVEVFQAQAREAKLDRRTGNSRLVASSPELAEAIHLYKSGGQLTPVQEIQVEAYQRTVLAAWEWQFHEYERGRFSIDDLALGSWRAAMEGNAAGPGFREFWDDEWRHQTSPQFVEFIEQHVLAK